MDNEMAPDFHKSARMVKAGVKPFDLIGEASSFANQGAAIRSVVDAADG